MNTKVLLVGHGSPKPGANQPMLDAVTLLKQCCHNVELALLSEALSVEDALSQAGALVVIPLLASRGFFYERLKTLTDARAKTMLTKPVGQSDALLQTLQKSARAFCDEYALSDVVVVGHGTPKRKHSAQTTRALVRGLSAALSQKVHAAFLEQAPWAEEVARGLRDRSFLVVPFFMGRGPHVTHDLAKAFGFDVGPDFPKIERGAWVRVCAPPLLDAELLAQVCETLLADLTQNLE